MLILLFGLLPSVLLLMATMALAALHARRDLLLAMCAVGGVALMIGSSCGQNGPTVAYFMLPESGRELGAILAMLATALVEVLAIGLLVTAALRPRPDAT